MQDKVIDMAVFVGAVLDNADNGNQQTEPRYLKSKSHDKQNIQKSGGGSEVLPFPAERLVYVKKFSHVFLLPLSLRTSVFYHRRPPLSTIFFTSFGLDVERLT